MRPTLLLVLLAACSGGEPAAKPKDDARAALTQPWLIDQEVAPETFRARFETTKGTFVIEATRAWAPHGVDRLYQLISIGYFDGARFFRVLDSLVQFGISGDPDVNAAWANRMIPADPVRQSNGPGMVTFAHRGRPDMRSTQLFVNLAGNDYLDSQGFAPVARVIDGLDVVRRLYSGYGESPDQSRIVAYGDRYLAESYPALDRIERVRLIAP